jgi:hypothetical protein
MLVGCPPPPPAYVSGDMLSGFLLVFFLIPIMAVCMFLLSLFRELGMNGFHGGIFAASGEGY